MKILLVNKFFYFKGGADTSFFNTARLLKQKGHKVIFFSMKDPKNNNSEYDKYFVENVDYETKGLRGKVDSTLKILYSVEAQKKIEELIMQEKPDIAHLHSIYHQISPSILYSLRKFNIPVVMTLHDYKMVCASYRMLYKGHVCESCKNGAYYHCFWKGCVKNSKAKSLVNTVEMYFHHKILKIYDLVNTFISPSVFLKDKLKKMSFKGNIAILPYCASLEGYTPYYNWTEKSVLYSGRLSHEKGLFTLLEAMKGIDTKLKIAGEGPIEKDLKSKVARDNMQNIDFLGYKNKEELKDEISKSMLCVVPSEWYENYPYAIIESFCLGRLVVGSKIGGIPELVKDNKTGLTFEAGNANDLRLKMSSLIDNTEKVIEMGKNARAFVEKELNSEKHYEKLIKIYRQLLILNCGA